MGYIYLLQRNNRSGTRVFKLGQTTDIHRRLKDPDYKNCTLYFTRYLGENNIHIDAEKEIILLFKQKYSQCYNGGNESFKGDVTDMINDMNTVCDNLLNKCKKPEESVSEETDLEEFDSSESFSSKLCSDEFSSEETVDSSFDSDFIASENSLSYFSDNDSKNNSNGETVTDVFSLPKYIHVFDDYWTYSNYSNHSKPTEKKNSNLFMTISIFNELYNSYQFDEEYLLELFKHLVTPIVRYYKGDTDINLLLDSIHFITENESKRRINEILSFKEFLDNTEFNKELSFLLQLGERYS